jgi:DNA mismatch repair protein MutL
MTIEDLRPVRAFRYPRLPIEAPGQAPASRMAAPEDGAASPPKADAHVGGPPAANSHSPWSWCRVVGQIGNLYVVLETEDGFVLMDPHATHERVLFDRFMAAVQRREVSSQALLMPETVELGPQDAVRLRKVIDVLKVLGFGISEFGGDSFVVDALPAHFAGAAPKSLLIEISHELELAGTRSAQGRWREEAIAQAACKAAVKSRDKLRLEEIEQLVVDLARTEMPYTCPHGRPTLIFTSYRELNRKFGRE